MDLRMLLLLKGADFEDDMLSSGIHKLAFIGISGINSPKLAQDQSLGKMGGKKSGQA
jgi:hypothetical protein